VHEECLKLCSLVIRDLTSDSIEPGDSSKPGESPATVKDKVMLNTGRKVISLRRRHKPSNSEGATDFLRNYGNMQSNFAWSQELLGPYEGKGPEAEEHLRISWGSENV